MGKYIKMYGWMYEVFRNEEFTINDFKAVFPSPSPGKIIYDLIRLNYVDRVKRGRYKVIAPGEFVRKIVEENLKQVDVLKYAKKKYAYCDNDAVSIWTDGYYWTGFTAGFKPIHIKILKRDLEWWRNFFKEKDVEFSIIGERRTLFGLLYVLHPEEEFIVEKKEGVLVIPLTEVIEFCKENELTYRPALEYLDKNYKLKLFEEYEYL